MEFSNFDRRLSEREICETIIYRSRYLDHEDQVLLKQVLERGASAAEIARMMGFHARIIQRRVRRLIMRLADPNVVNIIRNHRKWDEMTADVALAVWVRKWTLRKTAEVLKISLHKVRQRIVVVKTLLREINDIV